MSGLLMSPICGAYRLRRRPFRCPAWDQCFLSPGHEGKHEARRPKRIDGIYRFIPRKLTWRWR